MVRKAHLLAAVERRLTRYLKGGPNEDLLTDEATLEAELLLQRCFRQHGDDSLTVDAEGLNLVASLYWCRGVALGEDAGEAEFDHAAELFGLLNPITDDPVPVAARKLRSALRREEAQAVPRLLAQAEAHRDVELLDAAIRILRRVLEPLPTERDYASAGLHNLSIAYGMRHGWLGEANDVEHAVEVARSAAALMGAAVRPEQLANLASVLQRRYVVMGKVADLDESIEVSRMGLATAGREHDAVHWSTLAGALLLRYTHAGRESDLATAIEAGENALSRTADGDANRALRESYLSRALQARHWRSRRPGNLDKAVDLARAALRHTAEGHPTRLGLRSNLAGLLRDRYGQTGAHADLDEAIDHLTAVVGAAAEHDSELPRYLSNLGVGYRVRYESGGDLADLDAAVANGLAAMRIAPPGLHDWAGLQANVCLALTERYGWSGERGDLDEATRVAREVVAALTEGTPETAKYLHILSRLLQSRYDHSGELEDLAEALAIGREAIPATPSEHRSRGLYLTTLSIAQRKRYDWTRRPEDLDEAIELASSAVDAYPEGHPDRAGSLSNAGVIVGERGRLTGCNDDLDRAVDLIRTALTNRPSGHRSRPWYLSNLGRALLDRYQVTGDRRDLDEAVFATRKAVTDTPANDLIARATCLLNQGHALAVQYAAIGDAKVADEAATALEEAARTPAAGPDLKAQAALEAGRLAASRGQWQQAAHGYANAVAHLPAIVGPGLGRRSQEHHLTQWAGLPVGAAAMAVAAGRPEQAVELLESGRGLLLVQGMETRAGLNVVKDLAPDLGVRLESTAAAMRAGGGWDEPALDVGNHLHRQRRRDLGEEWERAVGEARALPGLADFLRAPDAGRLRAAAAAGPIVIVNTSVHRCDALIVTPDRVRQVGLDTTAAEVAERATTLLRAVLQSGDHPAEVVIIETLRWLWRAIARPVLAELDLVTRRDAVDLPRLWWCPTGPMTYLPLHAAQEEGEGGVLDHVISSYTPTIRALAHAAAPSATGPAPSPPDALVVAQPGHGLIWAAEEAAAVCERFARATVLIDAEATREATISALSNSTIAHFACHGVLDLRAPSASGLRLHDGTMTVLDVSRLHLRRAELAYLSACSTAVGGTDLMDEAIHLTSALQLAGFRQVIGTLWPVPDLMAVQVAQDVYARLVPANGPIGRPDGAAALHHAVRGLRASHPHRPFLWASYLHIGP